MPERVACSTKTDWTRLQVPHFKALDLPLGCVGRDAVRLFNLVPEAHTPAGNQIELVGGEHRPVCVYFVPEPGPVGSRAVPIHFSLLLRGHSPAHHRSWVSLAGHPCNACVAPFCAGIPPLTVDPGRPS